VRVRGERPAAIRWFAALFLAQALVIFVAGMADLDGQLAYYASRYPDFAFDRDLMIVLTSARLSIAAIPVALVWFFASRFARAMATGLGLLKLGQLVLLVVGGTGVAVFNIGVALWGVVAVSFLFTATSREWFRRGGRLDAAAFD